MTIGHNILVDPHVWASARSRVADLMIHELIHVRQWAEHGRLPFLFLYVADYVAGRFGRLSHKDAYRAIRFETEARLLTDSVVGAGT